MLGQSDAQKDMLEKYWSGLSVGLQSTVIRPYVSGANLDNASLNQAWKNLKPETREMIFKRNSMPSVVGEYNALGKAQSSILDGRTKEQADMVNRYWRDLTMTQQANLMNPLLPSGIKDGETWDQAWDNLPTQVKEDIFKQNTTTAEFDIYKDKGVDASTEELKNFWNSMSQDERANIAKEQGMSEPKDQQEIETFWSGLSSSKRQSVFKRRMR